MGPSAATSTPSASRARTRFASAWASCASSLASSCPARTSSSRFPLPTSKRACASSRCARALSRACVVTCTKRCCAITVMYVRAVATATNRRASSREVRAMSTWSPACDHASQRCGTKSGTVRLTLALRELSGAIGRPARSRSASLRVAIAFALRMGSAGARTSLRIPSARRISCSAMSAVGLRAVARRTASSRVIFSCPNAGAAIRSSATASSRRMRSLGPERMSQPLRVAADGGSAAPGGVAPRRRTLGTPRSSLLARLAAPPPGSVLGCDMRSSHLPSAAAAASDRRSSTAPAPGTA